MKGLLVILVLLLTQLALPQSNVRVKPSEAQRLSWNASVESDVFRYGIFWAQGADTTLFPFRNGTDPDSLWNNEAITNWMFAQTYNRYYYHEPATMPGITYIRYGVAPINNAGKVGRIRTYYKVIRIAKPSILPNIKVD